MKGFEIQLNTNLPGGCSSDGRLSTLMGDILLSELFSQDEVESSFL